MVKCNKDQVERLKKALKREEDPVIRQRIQMVLLREDGKTQPQIAELTGVSLTGLFNSLYLKCKRTGESKTLHPGEKWRLQRGVGFQRRKISDSLTGNPNQKSRGCRGIRFVSDPIGRNRGPATGRR